jgi:Lactate racemase N-terminal domain
MERFPKLFKIRQKNDAPRVENPEREIHHLLDGFELSKKVLKGERVGLTGGSRGIQDKPKILKALADRLKAMGAFPVIVPCMGSHGGATAKGQAETLKNLGIAEETMGVPILSSMEVREIGRTRFGTPVLIDRNLCEVDKIVVINRIKPHTDFKGKIESGLIKMMVMGMGKHEGAMMAHRLTLKYGFPAVLSETGSVILNRLPILFGIGIIENQREETAFIDLLKPDELVEREQLLLKKARDLMPRLPFDQIDLLIVDEIGKDVSGSGMDTNVIGRISFIGTSRPEKPRITRIFVRDLTEATHGNATGIGMADYTTKRLVDRIDYASTHVNCITAMTPEDGRVPIFFERDQDAISAACDTSGVLSIDSLRILWIKNTLHLETLFASHVFLEETSLNPNLEIQSDLLEIPLDESGNLISPWV